MATTYPIEAPVHRGLTEFRSTTIPKAASQSWAAGDIIITASGLATDFAAGASAVGLGLAGQAAVEAEAPSGSPNYANVDVYLLDEVLTEINLVGTHAAADIGAEFGLDIDSGATGFVYVKKSDTTNKRVRVLARLSGAVGDSNVRVLVRWLPADIL